MFMTTPLLVLLALTLASVVPSQEAPKPKRIDITITAEGFSPSNVTTEANVPVELVFTRVTDTTCAKEVIVPDLKIKKTLPLKEPVSIVLTPEKKDIAFVCGMNMLKGKLVVK